MVRVVLVPWFSSVFSVDTLIFHRGGAVGCVVDVTIAARCDRFWCRVPGDGVSFLFIDGCMGVCVCVF